MVDAIVGDSMKKYLRSFDLKILMVDDEEMLVELVTDFLENFGYTEHKDEINLVITDQTMPGMIGTQLAKYISAEKPNIPIILCTGKIL